MFHRFVSRLFVLSNNITTPSVTHTVFRRLISSNNSGSSTFISNLPNQQFTVDYLINSCGLSPESALKASKRIVLKSPTTTNAVSVLSLLRTYGFTQPQISQLISSLPLLLSAKPSKTLKPKLDFFNSIGISGPNLGEVLARHASILQTNLGERTIPFIDLLRSFVSTSDDIARVLKRLKWGRNDMHQMEQNIAVLRNHAMPDSIITYFLLRYPQVLFVEPVRFKDMVLKLKKMGGNPSSNMFVYGLQVLLGANQPKWDAKLDVYKSFGWSEDKVLSVFVKQPFFMGASAKKIKLALDFFMNTLKWTQEDVARHPTIILYNFEKRTIPRCHVLQMLLSRGRINKASMFYGIKVAEEVFLKTFVIKHLSELPELLKVYQSKKNGTEDDCEI